MLITGNTYAVKTELRAMGGTWDSRAQGWNVPADRAEEARALVAAQGAASPTWGARSTGRYQRYGSNYTRFSSGAEIYSNKGGRCEDAPCCGCCS